MVDGQVVSKLCAGQDSLNAVWEGARSQLFHAASQILPPSWCRRLLCQSLLLFHCRRGDDERTDRREGDIIDGIAESGSGNCRAWEADSGAVMPNVEARWSVRFVMPRNRSGKSVCETETPLTYP